MNYMLYIEHSAENLKFFLWLRDYTARFHKLKDYRKALAPEWTEARNEAANADNPIQLRGPKKQNSANDIFKGTDFEETKINITEAADPFDTPPCSPNDAGVEHEWNRAQSVITVGISTVVDSNAGLHRIVAGEAFESAGLSKPCKSTPVLAHGIYSPYIVTIQPFREEITRIITTYIVKDAPCELNLSSRERATLFKALEYTTHPSAFNDVQMTIESSLRRQSHPNFIRWTICNGNPARVVFARGLGVFAIVAGLIFALLFTLSSASRGWRAFAAIPWVIGIAALITGAKGMCVVLHGMHRRHLRPWELFEDTESEGELKNSFDTLSNTNSYEDAPWIVRYEKRNIIRKVFDREVWIEEPSLRQIQDTIAIQSMLCAVVISAVLTAIFVAVPAGNFF